MAWRQRHLKCDAVFLFASLCILCTRCITDAASGNDAGADVQICEESRRTIQLEISGKTPAAKFQCGNGLTHMLPQLSLNSKGNKCFTDADCANQGSLPTGVEIAVDSKTVYTVQTANIPTENGTAYFLCTDTPNPSSGRQTPKKCTVEVAIKSSPSISEDRQCTQADQTVNIRLTAPTNEATFVCGGTLTTLAPADSTVFSDESCTEETKLDTLIPKATLTSGTGLEKQRHTLAIPTFPEKTTTLCYKCQGQNPAEACKVIITVDGTTATSTTTASTSGSRSVMAGAGGLAVVWVAALFTGILCRTYL